MADNNSELLGDKGMFVRNICGVLRSNYICVGKDEFFIDVSKEAENIICGFAFSMAGKFRILRIIIEGGGCSGFSYKFDPVVIPDSLSEHDIILFTDYDMPLLVVDKIFEKWLTGSRLCYMDNLLSNFFYLDNPNAKSTCGCKKSVYFSH